ncbi:hypothetical protein B0H63DRAFT_160708 [Podospora didyma]|uniref:Uncharacterized protein n=1 Tax=Podospora didyma TaxID=330526 RepID=A0AAE0NTS0_9PEZI|nr:hypothetical protein B0H63DRAFT_160708 [Podospora didyma]
MTTKSVKFRSSPSSGGSHYSDDRLSDSGVGSFSGSDTRPTADRNYTTTSEYADRDYSNNIYTLQNLQNQVADVTASRDKYRRRAQDAEKKATEVEELLNQMRKDFKEVEAQSRAFKNRIETLESEKSTLTEEKEKLKDEVKDLKNDIKDLKRSSRHRSNSSSPVMSGAIPAESSDEKTSLRRSSSKRHSTKPSAREREKEMKIKAQEEQDEKERLRQRFNVESRADESDATKSSRESTKSSRRRRESYVEPLGQSAPRPSATATPLSPTRQHSAYTTAPFSPPQYTNIREPSTRAAVPRGTTVRPSVHIAYDSPFSPTSNGEDGGYHNYPLPQKNSRGGDRR